MTTLVSILHPFLPSMWLQSHQPMPNKLMRMKKKMRRRRNMIQTQKPKPVAMIT
jgi:hypothetical protein